MQLNIFTDSGTDYCGDVLNVRKSPLGYDIDLRYPEVADDGGWVHLSVGEYGSISERALSKNEPTSQP